MDVFEKLGGSDLGEHASARLMRLGAKINDRSLVGSPHAVTDAGVEYREIVSGARRLRSGLWQTIDGRIVDTIPSFNSKDEAVDAWIMAAKAELSKRGSLAWRVLPEYVTCKSRGKAPRTYVYSRFVCEGL